MKDYTKLPRWCPVEVRIADAIMDALLVGFMVPAFLTSPFGLYYLVKGGVRYYFKKSDFHREIKRLERRGFVALKKNEKGWSLKLLKKGILKQQKLNLDKIVLPKMENWDGKWRLFIFDIPEENRNLRNLLRRKIKSLGMYNVQRSVFAFPYDCRKELELITDYFDLGKYTTYAEVSYSDIDKELKSFFNLK